MNNIYTIRRPGHSSWGEAGSLADALHMRDEACRAIGQTHWIYVKTAGGLYVDLPDVYRAGSVYVAITSRGSAAYVGVGESVDECIAALSASPIQAAGPDWRRAVWGWVMAQDDDQPVGWAERELVMDSDLV